MENCIFCKIINNKIPCHKIYEDKNSLVFLDAFPATIGQALVIPKKHNNYIFNLSDKEYSELMLLAKKIARAIDKSLKPIRTCIVVEGFAVDHIHVRLHPCYERHLKFEPMPKQSDEEFKSTADKIKTFLK